MDYNKWGFWIAVIGILVPTGVVIGLGRRFFQLLSWVGRYDKIPDDRRKTLEGSWSGMSTLKHEVSGTPLHTPVRYEFVAGRRIISGECIFASPDPGEGERRAWLRGQFSSNRFLNLQYGSTDRGVVGGGFIFLELSNNGKELKGIAGGWADRVPGDHFFVCNVFVRKGTVVPLA